MTELRIRVLGPIEVELDGHPVRLSKRRHREILGLLVLEEGRAISTTRLIGELWDEPGSNRVGAVRTFIGELRQILEPGRQPRTPPRLLVTVGDGYALRLAPDAVDLWRVRRALDEARNGGPERVNALLSVARDEWSDDPLEEFADRAWAREERTRIEELRAQLTERLAESRLALGNPEDTVGMLEHLVSTHPWRESGWHLLARALYRSDRQADALAALRRSRDHLASELGLDPGSQLGDLERAILRKDPALDLPDRNRSLLLRTASAHAQTSSRAQLESASALLPGLAVSGGLAVAGEERIAAIGAAEDLGDVELAARIVGSYDVPGIWTRSDDSDQSALIVGTSLRLLSALPADASDRSRARLLATAAMESRGTADRVAEAREAERLARSTGDPSLLCFALAARYMQCFDTAGLAQERDEIGREILDVARNADLPTFEIHGRLIRMQALCALDDIAAAEMEAQAIDVLAARHERALATVFTAWFRWTFLGGVQPPTGEEMPGFAHGLAALADVTSVLREHPEATAIPQGDCGPYEPWTRPVQLSRSGQIAEAAQALNAVPDPPHDLMLEVSWFLVGLAALGTNHIPAARRALTALLPAASERAAGSGVIDVGPIAPMVTRLHDLVSTSAAPL